MSTSGGSPGPQVANTNATATPGTGAGYGAFLYANTGGGGWTPLVAGNQAGDAATLVDHLATGAYALNGATWDRLRTPKVFTQIATVAIGTEATIWTPTTGKKFRLMGWVLTASAAVTVTLRDNTAGTIIRTIGPMVAATPLASPPEGNGTLSAAANNVLTATSSAAANLTGYVFGTEE